MYVLPRQELAIGTLDMSSLMNPERPGTGSDRSGEIGTIKETVIEKPVLITRTCEHHDRHGRALYFTQFQRLEYLARTIRWCALFALEKIQNP